MPFEVFPIEGERIGSTMAYEHRDKNAIAREIAAVYEEVAERGGKIIGDHILNVVASHGSQGDEILRSDLFLVADIPEVT